LKSEKETSRRDRSHAGFPWPKLKSAKNHDAALETKIENMGARLIGPHVKSQAVGCGDRSLHELQ